MIEQMKPSGIDWIKDIPYSWHTNKVKYLATESGTLFLDGDWIESDVIEESGIRYLTTGNVGAGYYKEQGSGYISEKTFSDLHCLKVYPGDLMISRLNEPIGRACIVPEGEDFYVVAVDNVILRPNKAYNKKFIMYAMNTEGYAEHGNMIARGATMSRVSRSQLGQFWIAAPNLSEQTAIADFLDVQCSKLDSIIADLEKQIDTLQKYKKSLITETVTKGLDKTASMKDSGIEWIGKIPEHWEVKKFSYECERIGDIDHYMPDSVDEGIPYVMTGDFIGEGNDIDFENCKQISRQDYLRLSRKMKPMINDILFARYATIGTVRIVDTDKEFLVSYSCAIIRVKKTLFSKYVFYYLKSGAFYEEISKYINTNTQGNVGIDSIGRAKIPLPPVSEQEFIADFLDEKCTQIDELLQIKQSQLSSIKRHKKSLIYEYVTGKTRVTEVK